MTEAVIIYNLGGEEVLGRTTPEDAITMILAGKAYMIEPTGKVYRSAGGFEIDVPKSISLTKYVYARWKYERSGAVPFSRIGVFKRDNWTCAYCGKKVTRGTATADHILPKWKGNAASWANSVTSCQPCNSKKGGRSPQEAGMKLLFQPFTPTFGEAWKFTHEKD